MPSKAPPPTGEPTDLAHDLVRHMAEQNRLLAALVSELRQVNEHLRGVNDKADKFTAVSALTDAVHRALGGRRR